MSTLYSKFEVSVESLEYRKVGPCVEFELVAKAALLISFGIVFCCENVCKETALLHDRARVSNIGQHL